MALMGLIFPDEKREWWGRMGGIIHRFALIWILITAGALLLPDLIKVNFINIPRWIGPAGATWATLVGIAVRTAFKSAGEGSVVAMSGAAVSPNMGYHSSPATAFLLTMFNVRLGRWIGNPRQRWWKHSEPTAGIAYMVKDLIANTDINNNYVYLSDGGHFDNMGIYELVRRKCMYIVLVDGEQDTNGTCEGPANAIRRSRIDFGVEITIDTSLITKKDENGFASEHAVSGTICYPGVAQKGKLVYIKTAVTTTLAQSTDIREYKMSNPEFPQESTGDQFFNEAQFESYRKLGYLSIDQSMFI